MKGFCSQNKVELGSLRDIEIPEATKTYQPIGHYDLAMNIRHVADEMLIPKGYAFLDAECGTAREGQRVFGMFKYQNGSDEAGLAVGWRNSYDKSMSAAVALGANVFICDNMCISGDITVMRRHTKNIEDDLTQSIVGALYNASGSYQKFTEVIQALKSVGVADRVGYEALGYLVGEGILTPTIFNIAMRQWKNSDHDCFQERTAWSLYNAITEGLKEAPPHRIFEMHRDVHKVFVAEYIAPTADPF